MSPRLPPAALLLGVAGLIPFVALGILTLTTDNEALAQRYLWALVAYGGVILAFLGGIHWGFALRPAPSPDGMAPSGRREAARLGLGVLPSLIGWAAMLTPLLAVPEIGLAILIAGFVGVVATEARWGRREALPPGYMALRWGLSVVVVAALVTTLALRMIGAKITF